MNSVEKQKKTNSNEPPEKLTVGDQIRRGVEFYKDGLKVSKGSGVGGGIVTNPKFDPSFISPSLGKWPEPKKPEHTHSVLNLGFSEDRMVGVCEECGEVVHVMVFPGSLNTIRARILIETYAANKLASRYDDEVISVGDVAAEINMLRKLLDMDVQELEIALDRLELIERDLVANI